MMAHIYKITGMTCNGCRSHVEKNLNEVEGVTKASVNLEKAEAVIEMESHIIIEKFQEALKNAGGNYQIFMPGEVLAEKAFSKDADSGKVKGEKTHPYKITGMSCNGCRSSVEKALNEVEGVTKASVNLEKGEAVIEMEKPIEIESFQEALKNSGGDYNISILPKDANFSKDSDSGKVEARQTYKITGMSCKGCRSHVEKALNEVEGVRSASVDLEKAQAVIEMERPIEIERFQEALKNSGGDYQIFPPGEVPSEKNLSKGSTSGKAGKPESNPQGEQGTGTFYCPMHCQGDKTYDKPGDCPACGMDLVEEVSIKAGAEQYTCPMHPEVIKDAPGSCPICGMDLVPMEADASAENKTYKKLLKKFKIAVIFEKPLQ